MDYLRDAWYCAGWGADLDATPRMHTFLDEPVLMYRTASGSPVAVSDRCPHRFAPLHRGVLDGDVIQCPYHGLRFDAQGACVHNPHGDGRVPAAARLRVYPVVERHRALWIWMGDPARVAPDRIPALPALDDSDRYRFVSGHLRIAAHYEVVIDNLLDLSHVDYLHPHTFVHPGAMNRARFDMEERDGCVYATYRWRRERIFPLVDWLFSTDSGLADVEARMRWDPPANLWLAILTTEVGGSLEAGVDFSSAHLLTPAGAQETHYFWAAGRNRLLDDAEIDAGFRASVTRAFTEQDAPMLEAAARYMGTTDLFGLQPLMLPVDAAAVRARRVLAGLIAAERRVARAAAGA